MNPFTPEQRRTLRIVLSTLALDDTVERSEDLAAFYAEFVEDRLDTPWGWATTFYSHPPYLLADHPGHGWQCERSPASTLYATAPVAEFVDIAGARHDVLNDQTHRTVAAIVILWLERLRAGNGLAAIANPRPAGAQVA